MDQLTAEQLMQLCCLPPYFCCYEDVVAKHFGGDPPDCIYDFIDDMETFQKNVKKVDCGQDETDSNNQPLLCAQCKKSHEIIKIIHKHVQCFNDDTVKLIMQLFKLKCKIEACVSSEEELSNVIYSVQNLRNHVNNFEEFIEIIQISKAKE